MVANPDSYQYTFDHDRLWRGTCGTTTATTGSRRSTGSTPTATTPSTGSSTAGVGVDHRRPDLPWPRRRLRTGDPGDDGPLRPGGLPVPRQLPLVRRAAALHCPASRSARRRPTTYVRGPVRHRREARRSLATTPALGADLYTTNGETTDFAHALGGALAWTPSSRTGRTTTASCSPTRKARSRPSSPRTCPSPLSVAQSAADPDDRVAHQDRDRALLPERRRHRPPEELEPDERLPVRAPPTTAPASRCRCWRACSSGTVPTTRSRRTARSTVGSRSACPPRSGAAAAGGAQADLYYHIVRDGQRASGRRHRGRVVHRVGERPATRSASRCRQRPQDVLVVAAEDYTGTSNVPAYRHGRVPALATTQTP